MPVPSFLSAMMLFITLYKVLLIFMCVYGWNLQVWPVMQMKAIEQHLPVALFIYMLNWLQFVAKIVDEIPSVVIYIQRRLISSFVW